MKLNEAVSRRLGELLQKQGMTQYQLSSSVTLHPNCAAALGNRTRLGEFTQFHNPTGGVRRHLPLHKGGFSLPHCIQPTFVLLLSAAAQFGRPDTGP